MCDCKELQGNIIELQTWLKKHETEEMNKHKDVQSALEELSATQKAHIQEVQPILDVVQDLKGFAATWNRIYKIIKWIGSLAIVGWLVTWISQHLPK